MATSVRPELILKQLAKLWVDLGKEEVEPGSAGVLRACAMTLIVAVSEKEDPQGLGETISELMHEHPSRVIVLRVCGADESRLESRVFAQCWKPFGRHQQICCEQVEITASPSRFPDVPKLVLGLTVPDLPVVLWSRSILLTEHPEAQQLFTLPDKIVVDSSQLEDAEAGLKYVRGLFQQGRNVADLEWTRITFWRETVSQIFENERNIPYLKSIRHVTISHEGDVAPVRARYLGLWFTHSLPDPIEVTFEPAPSQSGSRICGIAMDGEGFEASLSREGSSVLLSVNGRKRRTAFPKANDYLLMSEELSIVGADPVFRKCLGLPVPRFDDTNPANICV